MRPCDVSGATYDTQHGISPIDASAEAWGLCMYVWIAYGNDAAHLPIAVADSARELGAILGTTKNNIMSAWSKYNAGRIKSCRYHRVNIGSDDLALPQAN